MKKVLIVGIVLIFMVLGYQYYNSDIKTSLTSLDKIQQIKSVEDKKKVLLINSYHKGYEWTDGITNEILTQFHVTVKPSGELDVSKSIVDIKIINMDTKRNRSEEFKLSAAELAKKEIDNWKPDLVITSDDNASKYLVVPYYKDSLLPFLFCGVNWSAKEYGFPCENVTGMLEVQLIDKLIEELKKYSKGNRIAYLKGDDESARKEAFFYDEYFHLKLDKRFVTDFSEWKTEYKKLQKESDIILLGNSASIKGWNNQEAKEFIDNETKVPTGNWDSWMRDYCLITFANKASEQGEWVASKALEILSGKPISSIPIEQNHKIELYINMGLANKLAIKFPIATLQQANLINASKPKVMFINSYHKGYEWSDGIEVGLLRAFGNKDSIIDENIYKNLRVNLKMMRMDTKRHRDLISIKKSALEVKKEIMSWKPDIIIASDDNASKYVVVPYLMNSDIPIIFCGVNWDASIYGFPTEHIKGMIEIEPVIEVIEQLKSYSKGTRIGYLGVNTFSEQKNIEYYSKHLGIKFSSGKLVNTYDEWKKAFILLQDSVDLIINFNHTGIENWDVQLAKNFILENIKIPSGTTISSQEELSLIGRIKVPGEQGWWAGNTALKVLQGTPISTIGVTQNKNSLVVVNTSIARALGIKFSVDLLKEAIIIK